MAFSVSYIFTARDKYTAIARKITVANQKLQTSVQRVARSFKDKLEPSFRKIRNIGLGMSAAISLPFLLAARSATRAASDAEETRSKFATIFRDISSDSESVADSFAKNFGLAGTTARMLLGDTADILTGFGFTQKGALDLANQVNELAVDLASFTNFAGGAEGASAALTKALLGERESLKSLGIAITEDLVKKKISVLVSQGAKFASLAEAKARATLAIAVEQSGNAIGDYARTQNAAANVSRRLGQQVVELKETFGRILLPISVRINNALINFIDTLNTLSPGMQKVILIVGGVLAALGPLLLIIGAIGLALPAIAVGFAAVGTAIVFMTGPIGIIIALTAAIITFLLKTKFVSNAVAGLMFKIVNAFKGMGKIVAGIIDRVVGSLDFLGGIFDKFKGFAASIGLIDLPTQELALKTESIQELALNSESITALNNIQLATTSPAVATANASATVNGQINVSASPGSQIDSIESNSVFGGPQGNIGLGIAQ